MRDRGHTAAGPVQWAFDHKGEGGAICDDAGDYVAVTRDPEHHLGGKETTAEARAVQLFWKRADHKDPGLGDRHVLDLWDRGSALILYPVWEQYICLRLK